MNIYAGHKSEKLMEYLLKRRSVVVKNMGDQAPDKEQQAMILEAAARVPDHGKVVPFYFLVFDGEYRRQAGEIFAKTLQDKEPDISDDKLDIERNRFMRAPLVIAVVYRPRQSKNVLWEQVMSVGAACQNMILAANASGFGAQWLSEWIAYDRDVLNAIGLDEHDHIGGYIYIGNVLEQPLDRDRPDLEQITTRWEKGRSLQKGDMYHREKFGIPEAGIKFPDGK